MNGAFFKIEVFGALFAGAGVGATVLTGGGETFGVGFAGGATRGLGAGLGGAGLGGAGLGVAFTTASGFAAGLGCTGAGGGAVGGVFVTALVSKLGVGESDNPIPMENPASTRENDRSRKFSLFILMIL